MGLIYITGLTTLLAYGLYHRALFFSIDQLQVSLIILAIELAALAVLTIGSKKLPPTTTIPMLLYATFALVSSLWGADKVAAVSGAVLLGAAALLGIVTTHLTARWRTIALAIILASGAVTFVFGLATTVGLVHYKDALEGTMLASFFQYHNTFGSYELSVGLMGLILGQAYQKYWQRFFFFSVGIMSLTGCVASFSRMVWIIALVAVPVTIAITAVVRHAWSAVGYGLYLCLVTVATVPFTIMCIHHGSIPLLLASVCVPVLGGFLGAYVPPNWYKRGTRYRKLSVITGVVSALVMLTSAVLLFVRNTSVVHAILQQAGRITLFDYSLQSRFWYYGAALKMWEENPIFGSGYGAWSAKFQAYQQYPYWSTMTHSVFFEQLVSYGIIGLALWLLYFGACSWVMLRSIRQEKNLLSLAYLIGVVTLVIHSFFDFDMDFGLMIFITTILLFLGGTKPTESIAYRRPGVMWYTPLMAFGVLVLAFGGTVTMSLQNTTRAEQVTGTNKLPLLNKALRTAPYNFQARAELAIAEWNQVQQTRNTADAESAWIDLKRATIGGKWNPSIQETAATIAYNSGHLAEAYSWSHQAAVDAPFSAQYPEKFMGMALWCGVEDYNQHLGNAQQKWNDVLNEYKTVLGNIEKIQSLPSYMHAERPYAVSPQMLVYTATAQYCLKDYSDSLVTLAKMPHQGVDPDAAGLHDIVYALDKYRLGQATNQGVANVFIHEPVTIQQEYQVLSNINVH